MIIETKTPQETFEVGKKIGENAKPGQIYTLTGDLGVGKTVFTQGVASGLGITEPICSPTFTIIQEYESGRILYITLMFTVSVTLRKWRKSDMMIISSGRESA